jgi:hypothetical protein
VSQQGIEVPEQGAEPYRVGYGKPPREFQWKPGQSGNPNGRRLSAAINKRLEEAGRPEKLVDSMLAKIENDGDVAAFREIITRHEGHVPTKNETRSENYFFIEERGLEWPDESP